ncbi:MAG: type II/IV secretion system protein [Planctomycetes bacterium]|nr:type II/IV secretion system protein [Planctomycetota bacterium]
MDDADAADQDDCESQDVAVPTDDARSSQPDQDDPILADPSAAANDEEAPHGSGDIMPIEERPPDATSAELPAGDIALPTPTPDERDADPDCAHDQRDRPTEDPGLSAVPVFIRKDPKECPRPPDPNGGGLADVASRPQTSGTASPSDGTIRPDDGLTLLWSPATEDDAEPMPDGTGRFGSLLQQRGIVAADQLATASRVIKQSAGRSLASVLLEMGVEEEPLQKTLAEVSHLDFENIEPNEGYHRGSVSRLGVDFCKQHMILPLRKENDRLVIGTASPEDVFLLDEARRRLGVPKVRHVLVTRHDINLVLEILSEDDTDEGFEVDELLADIEEDDVKTVEEEDEDQVELERQAGESPVIRYVNYIIQTAMREGASDIHIEPGEKKLKVRFRIDGILVDMMKPPYKMHAALISRLKIMANLDIAERRLPQDGRIRVVVSNRKLDLRVSTLPTVAGEKCVMRILDTRSISVGLDQLGFSEDALMMWRRQIKQPHGIILVTGPTGSGKTTTLYSSLKEMDAQRLNISTVEDPVEYHLDTVNQVQIHDQIGMSFAAALRSLLRQDPDVVMVGEIRDIDTAAIAIQASLTGHLVLSTLHTNDAPSSVTRLINIGVEPFLVGAALNAVLAQRLVRRLCPECRAEAEPSEDMADFLSMQGINLATLYEAQGCDRCRQTGYSGRCGIYELLMLDDSTRDTIARSPNVSEFRRMCVERGMVTLRQDGMSKVAKGVTTVEEVLRVTEATI